MCQVFWKGLNVSKTLLKAADILAHLSIDVVVVVDDDFKLWLVNPDIERVFGEREHGKLAGKPCFQTFFRMQTPKRKKLLTFPVGRALLEGRGPYTKRQTAHNGRVYQLTAHRLADEQGNIVVLEIWMDLGPATLLRLLESGKLEGRSKGNET